MCYIVRGTTTCRASWPNQALQEDPLAAFSVHFSAGLTASGIAATSVMLVGLATAHQMVVYFLLGIVGSLLPDVDSKSSAPVHVTFALLSTLLAFVAMFYFADAFTSVAELLVVWLATYLVFRWFVFFLFNRLTDHRGLFHSLPAAALAVVATAALAHRLLGLSALDAWMTGCFVGLGYLVHLLLDELYSVHLFGMHHRRSFGTALKVYRKGHPVATLSLYLAVAGVLLTTPDATPFVQTVADPKVRAEFQNRFLPSDGWFSPRHASELTAKQGQRKPPSSET